MKFIILALITGSFIPTTHALSVKDDTQQIITLAKPAERVITLAPSLTEMVFSVGAQAKLVATVKSSNYPAAANNIARVGDYQRFNLESILAFKPDLILAWTSGNNRSQLEQIRRFNIPIYQSEPRELTDIARTIRNIGILLGHQQQANNAADQFLTRLNRLKRENKNKPRLKAFYQIWHEPIYTVNGQHTISRIMDMCGLDNIFKQARILAPKITQEAVIEKNPDIIIASGMATGIHSSQVSWLYIWKKWSSIRAVKNDNLFFIHPDLINRQSARILEGAEIMCKWADEARINLRIKSRH